jgi:hypothetical protein
VKELLDLNTRRASGSINQLCETRGMVSVTTIIKSGYYILSLLPTLLWIPVNTRLQLRRATGTFENELVKRGLEPAVAQELANAFNEAYRKVIKEVTSPRNWTPGRVATEA